jgi:hypothetical protein
MQQLWARIQHTGQSATPRQLGENQQHRTDHDRDQRMTVE